MSQVGIEGDSLELLTRLHALATADTAVLTLLDGQGTLVLVVAEHHDLAALGTLGTEFDDATGTSLLTGTATGTLGLIDLGNAGDGIDLDGPEETGVGTVTLTQTAIETLGLAHTRHLLDATAVGTIILYTMGTRVTGTRATHHSHLGSRCTGLETQDARHTLHDGTTARSTVQITQRTAVGGLDAGSSKTTATGVAAATTVCLGQNLGNLSNAWVFMHSKLLGCKEQYHGCDKSDASKHNYCNQNYIHVVICF